MATAGAITTSITHDEDTALAIDLMVVYGTRPEAIKVAPIIKQLQVMTEFNCLVAVTGQHRAMLDQINQGFGITPEIDLEVFSPGQGPSLVAAKTIERLDPVLESYQPKAVLVQGDTSSAFAAGLAAFYRHIPTVHIEAGLRTDNLWSPFPEEANRRMLSQISSLHLCPTATNRDNLIHDGIDPSTIAVTGNTVIDALRTAVDLPHQLVDESAAEALSRPGRLVLVTSHRRESWGQPMARVAAALAKLADNQPAVTFLFPLHKNPLVRDIFVPALAGRANVVLTEPLDYLDLAKAMATATIILTDSGGIQEEGPSLGKPVLVLREDTERPEGVTAGTAKLVGTDTDRIVSEATRLLTDPVAYRLMAMATNPYGDGMAAQRSCAALAEFFGLGERMADFTP